MREVEDILLSEGDDGVKARVKAVMLVRSEPGTGRFAKWPKRKCRFQQKYQETGPLNNRG